MCVCGHVCVYTRAWGTAQLAQRHIDSTCDYRCVSTMCHQCHGTTAIENPTVAQWEGKQSATEHSRQKAPKHTHTHSEHCSVFPVHTHSLTHRYFRNLADIASQSQEASAPSQDQLSLFYERVGEGAVLTPEQVRGAHDTHTHAHTRA